MHVIVATDLIVWGFVEIRFYVLFQFLEVEVYKCLSKWLAVNVVRNIRVRAGLRNCGALCGLVCETDCAGPSLGKDKELIMIINEN